MRLRQVVPVLCATLPACEPPPETLPDTPGMTPAPAMVVESRFNPVQPLSNLPDTALAAAELTKARAVGIVYSTFQGTLPGELTVLNDTAREVQTVARLRFYPVPEGGHTDTLWARRAGLFGETARASHDDYGLQAASTHGKWVRVNYAYDSTGVAQQGWVRIEPNRTIYVDYDALMRQYITQFADVDATRFYTEPDGRRVRVNLSPSYSVRVLETNPEWIRVALTMPDTTACTGNPGARVLRRDTVWVPRVNEEGRRQIAVATAGC